MNTHKLKMKLTHEMVEDLSKMKGMNYTDTDLYKSTIVVYSVVCPVQHEKVTKQIYNEIDPYGEENW